MPVGVPGEIFISGLGLGRGYLDRPGLTAEKFIPNPFSDTPGARMYRTGDLARYLPDGNIEFLGRIDHQVKIRGFRIELGEIETLLGEHPAVQQVVVVAAPVDQNPDSNADQKRLLAYLVPNKGHAIQVTALRQFLKEKLPDYMLPSAFIELDAIPLTPNGKIDRRALPEPSSVRPEALGEPYVPPHNPIEEMLVNIWGEVLRLDKIGIHDNFFELGGHSLLATQLVSCINNALDTELALRTLFERPTVSELARVVEANQGITRSQPVAPILPGLQMTTSSFICSTTALVPRPTRAQ